MLEPISGVLPNISYLWKHKTPGSIQGTDSTRKYTFVILGAICELTAVVSLFMLTKSCLQKNGSSKTVWGSLFIVSILLSKKCTHLQDIKPSVPPTSFLTGIHSGSSSHSSSSSSSPPPSLDGHSLDEPKDTAGDPPSPLSPSAAKVAASTKDVLPPSNSSNCSSSQPKQPPGRTDAQRNRLGTQAAIRAPQSSQPLHIPSEEEILFCWKQEEGLNDNVDLNRLAQQIVVMLRQSPQPLTEAAISGSFIIQAAQLQDPDILMWDDERLAAALLKCMKNTPNSLCTGSSSSLSRQGNDRILGLTPVQSKS